MVVLLASVAIAAETYEKAPFPSYVEKCGYRIDIEHTIPLAESQLDDDAVPMVVNARFTG